MDSDDQIPGSGWTKPLLVSHCFTQFLLVNEISEGSSFIVSQLSIRAYGWKAKHIKHFDSSQRKDKGAYYLLSNSLTNQILVPEFCCKHI